MMQRATAMMLAGLLALTLGGCAATSTTAETPASRATVTGAQVPANSPLAKIQLGMTKKQVKDLVGTPSDKNSYWSAKVWIPFYFGSDARRTSYYYTGMGRVVFGDGNVLGGGGNKVIRVDYDPSESGEAR